LYSQHFNDSIKELPVVDITASRLDNYTTGLMHQKIDSISFGYYQTSSLADIIGDLTPIYVKSYGNNLSTISFRGTAAHHTGIYWNGFNMNLANIGMSDLSLFPLAYFETVEILHGGASSLYGSGNIGGSIHLKNKPVFKRIKQLNLELGYGSFEEKKVVGKVMLANNKWYSKTVILGTGIRNNFTYIRNNESPPTETEQQNAQMHQYGIMQDIHRRISSDQYLHLSLWYQQTDRQIPATMTMAESKAWQIDRTFKSSLRYAKYFRRGTINVKTAYFNDYLHFVDEVINEDSEILVSTLLIEAEGKREVTKSLDLNAGVSYTITEANIEDYSGMKHQNILAFYLMLIQDLNFIPWKVNLNLRQELLEGYNVPFTPSIGVEGRIWRFLFGKMNISRNFRIPSMNDRYWESAFARGNEDLEPEKSLNKEVSLIVKTSNEKENLKLDISLTLYDAVINNWIQWMPSDQGAWTPENVMKVRSRGVESNGNLGFRSENINATLNLGYTFTKSTNQSESESVNNKQLIYVPLHTASGQIIVETKYISFMYGQAYTGNRYILRDNSESLPEYSIANVNVSRVFKVKKVRLGLQFDVLNIWDVSYQSIAFRPMPGRSYRISVRFIYN